MKIIAIHQPNFLPWMGFFEKMSECNVFVLFDDVQFTKGSYINRTKVQMKGRLEYQWLTIPVHYHYLQKINQVEIVNYNTFRNMTLETVLHTSYPKSFELLKHILNGSHKNLAILNIALIMEIKKILGIKTELVFSSQMDYDRNKTTNLVDIVKQLGGTQYLSGTGGSKDYLDIEQFHKENITVAFKDYHLYFESGTVLKYMEQ